MSKYVEDAKKLSDAMLKTRRALVDAILNHGKPSTADLERLSVISNTIALAASIQSDEELRSRSADYKRREQDGTLVDDEYGNKVAPNLADLELAIKQRTNP